MKKVGILIAALGAFIVPAISHAAWATGTVYAPYQGCDYFLIQDPYGSYSEAEWWSGATPDNGDTLQGNFQSYNFKWLYDSDQYRWTKVWIDDYWMTADDGMSYLSDKCDGYDLDTSALPPGVSSDYYDNSYGTYVPSPTYSPTVPFGATAQCWDGTYSFSLNHSGTCSYHGGVEYWLP